MLFRESTVTVVAVPVPTARVIVPCLIWAFGSANPCEAIWFACAREVMVSE